MRLRATPKKRTVAIMPFKKQAPTLADKFKEPAPKSKKVREPQHSAFRQAVDSFKNLHGRKKK